MQALDWSFKIIKLKLMKFIKLKLILCLGFGLMLTTAIAQTEQSQNKRNYKKARKAKYRGNIYDLVKEIVGISDSEQTKVELLFQWITNNIVYDYKAYNRDRINQNNHDVLTRGKALCGGYSKLFVEMCTRANILAVEVDGYSLGSYTSSQDFKRPDHAWNAVKIDGEWKLLDATWGTSVSSNNTDPKLNYFLSDPNFFIKNHYPSHPMWQLLDRPVQISVFKKTKVNSPVISSDYNYKDSISKFLNFDFLEKRVFIRKAQMKYNPTHENVLEYYHNLMDWAIQTLEQADSLFEIKAYKQAFEFYTKAGRSFLETKENSIKLYDWQIDYAASCFLQTGVILYNQFIGDRNRSESLPYFLTAKDFLKIATSTPINIQRLTQVNQVIKELETKQKN
jgi:hypothetical protein